MPNLRQLEQPMHDSVLLGSGEAAMAEETSGAALSPFAVTLRGFANRFGLTHEAGPSERFSDLEDRLPEISERFSGMLARRRPSASEPTELGGAL